MRRRILTSIRSERAAYLALAALSLAVLAVLVAVQLSGDQREVAIVNSFPGDGDESTVRLTEVTLTFDRPVDENAVESRLSIDPQLDVLVSWQGNTMRARLAAPPAPGQYHLKLAAGPIGRHSEPLPDDFELTFSVREVGLLLVRSEETAASVVAVRSAIERVLLTGQRVTEIAVSRDGTRVAAVRPEDRSLVTTIVDAGSGEIVGQLGGPDSSVAQPAWGPSNLLAAVRNERLGTNDFGAGRVWFVRTSGEFVAEADPSGEPTLGPAWSPDGQWLLFSAPASAQLRLRNMATSEVRAVGTPRAATFTWSPDSRFYAFEAALEQEADGALRQPVTIKSVDATFEATFGEPGEVMLQPVFVDNDTLALGRLIIGSARRLEIVFFSLSEQRELASFAIPSDGFIRSIEVHPVERQLLIVLLQGQTGNALTLDFDTGALATVAEGISAAAWLP